MPRNWTLCSEICSLTKAINLIPENEFQFTRAVSMNVFAALQRKSGHADSQQIRLSSGTEFNFICPSAYVKFKLYCDDSSLKIVEGIRAYVKQILSPPFLHLNWSTSCFMELFRCYFFSQKLLTVYKILQTQFWRKYDACIKGIYQRVRQSLIKEQILSG